MNTTGPTRVADLHVLRLQPTKWKFISSANQISIQMKKSLFFLFILAAMSLTNVWAWDFSAMSTSGHTLYFSISDGSVSVTYPLEEVSSGGNPWEGYITPAGDLVIPSAVTYNDTTYTVTSIGERAFEMCAHLTGVTIPNSVTFIGHSAFSYCTSLTDIIIPESVTAMGGSVFRRCSSLTSVTLPNSLTSLSTWLFYECANLTDVTLPESVSTIGTAAFSGCHSLASVTIPESVDTIGEQSFFGCESLLSVVIPNSVTYIGNNAFNFCRNLMSLTIGNSVTHIGEYSFYNCSRLARIVSAAVNPPVLEGDSFYTPSAFGRVDKTIPLCVPSEAMQSYANARGWSEFTNITSLYLLMSHHSVTAAASSPEEGSVTGSGLYEDGAIVTVEAVASPGYRFVRWSNDETANPYSFVAIDDLVLTAFFEPVGGPNGIDDAGQPVGIAVRGNSIAVTNAQGQMLSIYDINGRTIVHEQAEDGRLYAMPHTGVYVVKVGNRPARKVTVVR